MAKKDPAPLIYVDSCVYIDLITRESTKSVTTGNQRWQDAAATFKAIEEGSAQLASSSLIYAEVTCNGQTDPQKERIRDLLKSWFLAPSTVWTDVDRTLARDAAALISKYRKNGQSGKTISAADALHLAAAIRLKATHLMTHDGGFPVGETVEGVKVLHPAIVWPESLWEQAAANE